MSATDRTQSVTPVTSLSLDCADRVSMRRRLVNQRKQIHELEDLVDIYSKARRDLADFVDAKGMYKEYIQWRGQHAADRGTPTFPTLP